MWCTRWFLPLLLLPLPTAPPYFLLLFLFSLTMHAKPCFYCIILLTTLFVSSCYWQPFPLDSALSTPWAENITTFSEALNATIMSDYRKPLPSVMRAVDRCWCDFSSSSFFEPFNVSNWEHVSVERLKDDLEREQKDEDAREFELEKARKDAEALSQDNPEMPRTIAPSSTTRAAPTAASSEESSSIWSLLRPLRRKFDSGSLSSSSGHPPLSQSLASHNQSSPTPDNGTKPPHSNSNLPLIRREYDLTPYGLAMLIDFGWTREA